MHPAKARSTGTSKMSPDRIDPLILWSVGVEPSFRMAMSSRVREQTQHTGSAGGSQGGAPTQNSGHRTVVRGSRVRVTEISQEAPVDQLRDLWHCHFYRDVAAAAGQTVGARGGCLGIQLALFGAQSPPSPWSQ